MEDYDDWNVALDAGWIAGGNSSRDSDRKTLKEITM